MAIVLDPEDVRAETAALMKFRLRRAGFTSGAGGAATSDFAPDTTPDLATAQRVATRNAGLVSDDFPGAEEGDRPELATIAALRSAIELEASVPSMDRDRILTWREQLREYVKRAVDATTAGGGSEGEPGARVLAAVWDFGADVDGATVYDAAAFVEGAEVPLSRTSRRRLRW